MAETAYIHDGYTRDGYIAAREGLHPAVRFKYRPVMPQDRAVIFRKIQVADDPRRGEEISAAAVVQSIEEWDIRKQDGSLVKLATSQALRLVPSVIDRLFLIVMGSSGTDSDPEASIEDRAERADSDLEAALAGTTPEELEEKNSGPG